MVKTKVVKKQTHEKGDKKIIQKNLFEAKASKKGEYRTKDQPFGGMGDDEEVKPLKEGMNNGWWQSMQDGETCRTTDSNKVYAAVGMSLKEGQGINIQGFQEDKVYCWYMTRILTKTDSQKPSEKIAKKGKMK